MCRCFPVSVMNTLYKINYHTTAIYCQQEIFPSKATYANYFLCTWDNYLSLYVSYALTAINNNPLIKRPTSLYIHSNSTYNKVAFNEKLAIMKENLHTKYTPFTYKYIVLNEKLPITKQNLHIFFFVIAELSVYVPLHCYCSLHIDPTLFTYK